MRLLVVEDEPRLAGHLADACRVAGYAVDVAGDGEQADDLARSEAYDAIVLDLGLPKTDGLTLLARWRAVSTRTGTARPAARQRASSVRPSVLGSPRSSTIAS